MSKVLLVGDAPSGLNLDPKVPFIGSKCWPRLQNWMESLECRADSIIINQSDYTFPQLLSVITYHNIPVVALGNNASKALKDIPHFKLPHPSGLNRQINDKSFINQQLSAAKSYISNTKTANP